jgi:hypothetical protein
VGHVFFVLLSTDEPKRPVLIVTDLTQAALDTGTAIATVLIFFALSYTEGHAVADRAEGWPLREGRWRVLITTPRRRLLL